MSVSYVLLRVRRPIGLGGESALGFHELTEGLTFGAPADLKRRLRAANLFPEDDAAADVDARTASLNSLAEALGVPSLVDPRTGKALDIPKCETAQYTADDGRLVTISLWGDPVANITFDRPSPRTVLEVVDALPDLAPFGIWRDDNDRIDGPDEYRPCAPSAPKSTPLEQVSLSDTPFPDTRGLRWVLRTSAYLCPSNPVTTLGTQAFLPAGNAIAAIEADSGAVVWTRKWNAGGMEATATPDALVIAGDDPKVYGLDPHTGETRWETKVEGRITAPPTRISSTTVAFGTEGGCIYAIDCRTGHVQWWANWLPGPVYTRLARGNNHVIATSHDGYRGIVYAFADRSRDKPPVVHYIEPRTFSGTCICVPSMLATAVAGEAAFIMSSYDLIRLSLPDLGNATTIAEHSGDAQFERFVLALNDRMLAYAVPTGERRGAIRVIDAATLELRYEIPLLHTPSEPAVLDDFRFAFVLRPFRHDTTAEGKLVVVETATGRVLCQKALGFRSWQWAYAAAGEGALYTSTSADRRGDWSSPGTNFLACWDADFGVGAHR